MKLGTPFKHPLYIAPKVELCKCYRSDYFGSFIVSHFSSNNILITIIDSHGVARKSSYIMFDETFHKSLKCTEITFNTFNVEYRENVKDIDIIFKRDDTIATTAEESNVVCVYQKSRGGYYR